MARIEIHFTETFQGETVTVSTGGREAHRAEGLTTDARRNLARIETIELPARGAELCFEVAATGARATVVVDPSQVKFVAVSLSDADKLKAEAVTQAAYAREPRGYG
jgi:hypothetical protein